MRLPRIKLTQQTTMIVVAAAVVLVGAGVVTWALLDKPDKGVEQLQSFDEVVAKGMSYTDNGDVDGGLAYYDEQIKNRKDDSEKQQLLMYKSSFALQAKRPEVAVESAKQAEEMKSSPATLTALARAYDSQGNKEQAIFYYKKLIEISPKEGMGSRYISEWQRRIEELES